jgi:hypothetical protein
MVIGGMVHRQLEFGGGPGAQGLASPHANISDLRAESGRLAVERRAQFTDVNFQHLIHVRKSQVACAQEDQEPSEPPQPKLIFTVVAPRGTRNSSWLPGPGKPDCYCVIESGGKDLFTM